jgi:predicted NBD/HSP70 family sugar kinase
MSRNVGVLATHSIWVGLVEDNRLAAPALVYPEPGDAEIDLKSVPVEELVARIRDNIAKVRGGALVDSVGAGFPGIVRNGVIEESPNLRQLKGMRARDELAAALHADGIDVPVLVLNDADAFAAGIAATRGHLEKLIRVWYLGDGIGYGRYPRTEGVWEAGHMVVTLDPKERFCGCGGTGHLEGIMGHRAMRLRFLDLEPEEVFEGAKAGDHRCAEFVRMWHRALAAATATSIHFDGPGKFFIAGPNAPHVDTTALGLYLQDMVKMSPLQGSSFEVVEAGNDIALIGAAVSSSIR